MPGCEFQAAWKFSLLTFDLGQLLSFVHHTGLSCEGLQATSPKGQLWRVCRLSYHTHTGLSCEGLQATPAPPPQAQLWRSAGCPPPHPRLSHGNLQATPQHSAVEVCRLLSRVQLLYVDCYLTHRCEDFLHLALG